MSDCFANIGILEHLASASYTVVLNLLDQERPSGWFFIRKDIYTRVCAPAEMATERQSSRPTGLQSETAGNWRG